MATKAPGSTRREREKQAASTLESVGPLTRMFEATNIPLSGADQRVEANEEERQALARDFGIVAISEMIGDYRLTMTAKGIHIAGSVKASVTQTCVVTLEPFNSAIEEQVAVDFAESSGMPAESPNELRQYEPPDEMVNGQIDLGALTAEFLALGLDPYPRKPGVDFDYASNDIGGSPFARLAKLKSE